MVKILADSTCDLSPELLEKYQISIIPLFVRLGEEEFLDGIDITPERLYEWSDAHGETPKTAAPGVGIFLDCFEKLIGENEEAVLFTISKSMSVCFNNARLASEEPGWKDRVRVIDSMNLSTGIGLQIIEAAEMAKQGKNAREIEQAILSPRPLVRASFVVDTLTYLHRGGRCSGLAAMMGSILQLHPRIAVSEGAMRPEKKYRGRARKYVMDYVKDMEENLVSAKKDRVFITHSGCDQEIVSMVREYLESLSHFDEILVTKAGSVISSHCGPGTLGVLFIEGNAD